ncbi:Ig-like domain-containing protein [Schaalia vaccimaxillae]|uniref:Ig-like domain-containing protein n=1 Tax=Schaalia vaccimaxillae TaxID=183916 RepID=UPI0003B61175|nr:Ig-like domain-containing protein [Schaalia vaccimaxillae]
MASRAASRRRRNLLKRSPAIVVLVFAMVVSLLAIIHRGVETTEVNVDDGGIWVTNEAKLMVGHMNYDARVLDGAFITESTNFDIGQAGDTVTFSDFTSRSLAPVDVANVALGAATSLPEGASAMQGGTSLGVIDPTQGNLWMADATAPSSTSYTEETSLATGLDAGAVATSTTGNVYALSAVAGELLSVQRSGQVIDTATTTVSGLSPAADLTLTVVGDQPVGLDSKSNTLVLPDGKLYDLMEQGIGSGAVLQLPGPNWDRVLLSTTTALFAVPLDGGPAQVLGAVRDDVVGNAAAPVRHNGCSYGAWAVSGAYLRVCDDSTLDQSQIVGSLQGAGEITFRTNRTRIVLNDTGNGSVWLPDENMVLMDNWDEVEKDLVKNKVEEETPEINEEIADPERHEKNSPPEAVDDDFGIRPGRSTTLPVLQNDSDPDGDVLTARVLETPEFGRVVRTRGGRALQITDVSDEQTGTTTFTYEVTDGEAADTATVTLTVHPWSVNEGPQQLRNPVIKLGAEAQIEYNILTDWIDPDGDQIYLANAVAPDGLSIQYSEDGTVSVKDLGLGAGTKTIEVLVSDGQETTSGVLTVNVQEPGSIPPVANADFYVARVGEPLVLDPLTNDTDANGDALSLVAVSVAPVTTTLTPDLNLGTITFVGTAPGSYQFTYTVTDGPSTALGVIRVDVVAAQEKATPIAEDDLAVLPAGGSTLVAPLANDSDPAGGVLVVQSVEVPDSLGLQVTLIDRHLLRITAPAGLEHSVAFTYTVSNGQDTAKAQVTVVPTKSQDINQVPEVNPDAVKVRVGDIGSVAVLANDRSPAGLPLSVLPTVEDNTNRPELGKAFVTGNLVRLEAGDAPGIKVVTYTVRDSAGNKASSTVTFEVIADSETNSAPQPKALTAWAVTSEMTRIPVPLNGIDPDGDSVTLIGIEQSPTKGTVELGTDWLEYTPAKESAGTDVFTYIVEDRKGKQATARVRVGIAPPATGNQDPIAVDDLITIRSNREVSVGILVNDIDADGDVISLVEDSLVPSVEGLGERITGQTITFKSPKQEGDYSIAYDITDGHGGFATGTLVIHVKEDAPLQPPIARDDVVAVSELPEGTGKVRVPVTANDDDPDGVVADLQVSTDSPLASVDGQDLLITPSAGRAHVVYTITDKDGLSASAVVFVPGIDRTRPMIDETRVPLEVRAGEDVTVDIKDFVLVRAGRTAHIVDESTLKGSVGIDQGMTLEGDHTIKFHVSKDYVGKSSISFEARDGLADDDSALSAVLTIPLKVKSVTNHPPTLTPTAIKVAAGDDPVLYDLSLMVHDPDDGDPTTFAYELIKSPTGATVSLKDHTLSVQAAIGQPQGDLDPITVSVDDGSGPVQAQIPVKVVSSTAPLPRATDIEITTANAGKPVVVDLTPALFNPFKETRLRIHSVQFQVGAGTLDPDSNSYRLTITPQAGTTGSMVVTYKVADATEDPARNVQGRVVLVVRDRPEPPSAVKASVMGAGRAMVTFTPGANNGAEIDFYEVTNVVTGQITRCEITACQISGLTNGVEHAFSVRAHNDVDFSDSSQVSNRELVDAVPGKMPTPTIEAADRQLQISWIPPENEGSAIQRYTVSIAGAGGVRTIDVTGTSTVVSDLTNGQSYTVSIVAHNGAKQPSQSSDGAVGTPYGTPDTPWITSTVVTESSSDGETATLEVSWDRGTPQDAEWGSTTITIGSVTQTVGPNDTKAVLKGISPELEHTVSVQTSNARGVKSQVGTSTVRVSTIPFAPKANGLALRPTGKKGELKVVGLEKSPGRGYSQGELTLRYSVAGEGCSASSPEFPASSGVINSGDNAPISYDFCQTGMSSLGQPSASEVVTAPAVAAESVPNAPGLSATPTSTTQVKVEWTVEEASPAVSQAVLTANGTAIKVDYKAGSHLVTDLDPGKDHSFVLEIENKWGKVKSNQATASTTMDIQVVWSNSCGADVLPRVQSPADEDDAQSGVVQEPEPCFTFSLRPVGWTNNAKPMSCVVTSDVDNSTRKTVYIRGKDDVLTGIRTLMGSQAELEGLWARRPGLVQCSN